MGRRHTPQARGEPNDQDGTLTLLPQHPDQHRPERPILLAVDQEFREGAGLRIAPEIADPYPHPVPEEGRRQQIGLVRVQTCSRFPGEKGATRERGLGGARVTARSAASSASRRASWAIRSWSASAFIRSASAKRRVNRGIRRKSREVVSAGRCYPLTCLRTAGVRGSNRPHLHEPNAP
jgi:hypothetical protein